MLPMAISTLMTELLTVVRADGEILSRVNTNTYWCGAVFVIACVMVKLYEKKKKCSTSYKASLMGHKLFHQEALRGYCK